MQPDDPAVSISYSDTRTDLKFASQRLLSIVRFQDGAPGSGEQKPQTYVGTCFFIHLQSKNMNVHNPPTSTFSPRYFTPQSQRTDQVLVHKHNTCANRLQSISASVAKTYASRIPSLLPSPLPATRFPIGLTTTKTLPTRSLTFTQLPQLLLHVCGPTASTPSPSSSSPSSPPHSVAIVGAASSPSP
jgi:hypothetical protein